MAVISRTHQGSISSFMAGVLKKIYIMGVAGIRMHMSVNNGWVIKSSHI